MFNKREFIQFLKEEFPEGSLVSGDNEFRCRCRFCGDSSTNMYKARFYIALNDPSGLIFYHCFNCGVGGLLTPRVLRSICNAPSNLVMDIASLNKNNSSGLKYMKETKIYQLEYEDEFDDSIDKIKLQYFNDRLGLNLTYMDLVQNKIVISLVNLMKKNNIHIDNPNVVKDLDSFFIGALSMNNCLIYFRKISNKATIKDKHVKYSLFSNGDIKRYYMIPTSSNLNKRVRINIAEGLFDINSIFYNLRNQNRVNEIYIAIGSKAYIPVMRMCLLEFGFLDCEFHIYMDNDVEEYITRKIYSTFNNLGFTIIIHHNQYQGEKDYGVDINHIVDKEYVLSRGF